MRIPECDMCGSSGEQVKKLILGVKGGLCLDCVARGKAIFDNAEPALTSTKADFTRIPDGRCFLCSRKDREVVQGLHGGVCSSCLEMCCEMISEDQKETCRNGSQ